MRLTYVAGLCTTSVVLAAMLTPLGYLYARNAQQEATRALTVAAASVAPRVSETLDEAPSGSLDPLLTRLSGEHGLELSVRTPDGAVASSAAEGTAVHRAFQEPDADATGTRAWVAGESLVPAEGAELSVRLVLKTGDRGSAVLLVRQSADELRGQVLTAWAFLVASLPLALAGCLLPVLVQRRRTLYAARQLGAVLRALSEGLYHTRAEPAQQSCDLRELVAEVNRLADSVQTAMAERREFLADVAHQLRNPMIALRLRIENLGAYLPASASVRRIRLLADVDRLDRTLTDMLEHSRKVPAERDIEVVDVCGVVEECLRGWAAVAERRAVQLRARRPRHAWALARPGAVEQALDVLLDNAVKHAPHGSVVRLGVTLDDGWLRVEVRDEGPGLPPEDLVRATGRGWCRGPASGNGIGLSIAVRLIESCGGRLQLESDAASGVIAVLHLVSAMPTGTGAAWAARSTELSTARSELT